MENQRVDNLDHVRVSRAFSHADEGEKGYLTREELKLAVVEIFGYKPSKYEVDEMLSTERNLSSGISKELFADIMISKLAMQDKDDEIRQTFLAFDTRCRGFVSFEDAKRIFEYGAPFVKLFDFQRMFSEVDRDGDGRVSYRDFEYMMKYTNT